MSTNEDQAQASITAYSVAHAIRISGKMQEYQHLVSNSSVELIDYFLKTHQEQEKDLILKALLSASEWLPFTAQNWALNKVISWHYTIAISMRKHYIEDNVRRFIADKGEDCQVVVFGGGYDTMPVRLSLEFPGVVFFESDRGGTRNNKMRALDRLREDLDHPLHHFAEERDNLRFVYIDVTDENFQQTLANDGFDFDKPSIFVCEGLTMYLSESEISSLLDGIHSFDHPENELAISFMESVEDENSREVSTFFRSHTKEDYRSNFLPQKGLNYLNGHQFEASYRMSYLQMIERSGLVQNTGTKNIITQFIVSPVDYKPSQSIDGIEDYPLEPPNYSYGI